MSGKGEYFNRVSNSQIPALPSFQAASEERGHLRNRYGSVESVDGVGVVLGGGAAAVGAGLGEVKGHHHKMPVEF